MDSTTFKMWHILFIQAYFYSRKPETAHQVTNIPIARLVLLLQIEHVTCSFIKLDVTF